MKTVFAYIRVSTVKQGVYGSSLQEQQSAIQAYAERHDLAICEWFEERESAAKRGRRVFQRMLKLLERRRATGVIIHKIDRGARNLKDWADLGELMDRGVEMHFAHESLDLSSRGGRLAADIQAVVAADFIRNLKDEVRKGFQGRLKQGLYPLPAPIGYIDQGRGLPKLPDPVMAPLVRRVFELYATGRCSLAQLGDDAYRFGLRNRRGGRVTRNGFSKLLNNEFYIGNIHIRRTGDRFPGVHQPLVPVALFREVQAVLRGRKIQTTVRHDYAYRRLIACASCGYRLIGERQKGRVYYRCHTRRCPTTCLLETALDDHIGQALGQVSVPLQMYRDIAHEFDIMHRERLQKMGEHVRAARLQLAQIEERLARLTDAYIDQTIERPIYLDRKAKLLGERADAAEYLARLTAGDDPLQSKAKRFLELLERLCQSQNLVVPHEKREMFQSVTSNLRAAGKNLLFDWKFTFALLAQWTESACSRPQQDVHRTLTIKKLADRLFKSL